MSRRTYLGDILGVLPEIREHHGPDGTLYALLKKLAREEVEERFASTEPVSQPFGDFGSIILPYFSMGAVDSSNLFDIDELIIFSFYLRNRGRYHRAADIGANIGLHSILMARCGMNVRAFEPDPVHFNVLQENLARNGCRGVEAFNCAVSDRSGEMEFVRVLGNTTGSHLAGSKSRAYGRLEKFPVNVQAIGGIIGWADLMKLDAEGHEVQIVLATNADQWKRVDAMVEVESKENAAKLFDHFESIGVRMFTQKTGWRRARQVGDLPTSYREGMMFVSVKDEMPWD